jgi:hypothetical protein
MKATIISSIIEGKSTAYELGYGVGYAIGRFWPLIILCIVVLGIWIYWRKKKGK